MYKSVRIESLKYFYRCKEKISLMLPLQESCDRNICICTEYSVGAGVGVSLRNFLNMWSQSKHM